MRSFFLFGATALGATALLAMTAGAAHADEPSTVSSEISLASPTAAPTGSGSSGGEVTDRMTLPPGRVLITVDLAVSLSKDLIGKPFSLVPDVWYGVADKFTLGLVHSTRGAYGLVGGVGESLCLAGKSRGCAKPYDNVGIDARYQVLDAPGGGFGVAIDGGLLLGSFDPLQLAVKLGAIGHLRAGKIGLDVAPSLTLGVTERDTGNKELLALPVSLHYSAAAKVTISAQTGVVTPLQSAGDLFAIPLSLGGSVAVTPKAFVGLTFSLPTLLGGKAVNDGFDARTITIGGGYAL